MYIGKGWCMSQYACPRQVLGSGDWKRTWSELQKCSLDEINHRFPSIALKSIEQHIIKMNNRKSLCWQAHRAAESSVNNAYQIAEQSIGRQHDEKNCAQGKKMWKDRKFPDVTIKCTRDSHEIKCHRVMLAGSPVFEVQMERWSNEKNEITVDANGTVAEAVVKFLYTGELTLGVDCTEVLLLAHRYQISDLVSLAKAEVLKMLSPDTAVKTARVLRLLRDEEEHRQDWETFCNQVGQNAKVLEALALAV